MVAPARHLPFAAAFVIVGLCLAMPASAHDIRPGYLELTETVPGQFDVLFEVPIVHGIELDWSPVLPSNCAAVTPVSTSRTEVAVYKRWSIRCDGSLGGQTVAIQGLTDLATEVLVRVQPLDGEGHTARLTADSPRFVVPQQPSAWSVSSTYLSMGIEHILYGIDHLLFVLGLLILSKGFGPLVKTITSFTVGHSISLALATLGFVRVPSQPVAAAIALSIMFLAAELVRAARGATSLTIRRPWVVAFGFGILHGLGFAGALVQLGLASSLIPAALLFFNVGVEIGQLAFIVVVLCLLASLRNLEIALPTRFRSAPAYAMGTVATFWFLGQFTAML